MTLRLICAELFPAAFVAVTVNAEVPTAVGAPLIIPVKGPKRRPSGSVPFVTLHVIEGVPVAARICA